MKKLLSLLSVLTISGTTMSSVIAASPYQTEEILNSKINYQQTNNLETLNRSKRKNNRATNIIFLTPNFFEELNKEGTNFNEFKNKIKNELSLGIRELFECSVNTDSVFNNSLDKFARLLKNNWNDINNLWQDSTKQNRIGIYIKENREYYVTGYMSGGSRVNDIEYLSSFIMSEELPIINKYLSRLEWDLNSALRSKRATTSGLIPAYNVKPDFELNLGLIEDDNDITILNKVKYLHPSLDVYQFYVEESNYSHFKEGFSAKLVVKSDSDIYSVGTIIKVFFNTKAKINELSDKIQNDWLVIQWLEHIKDFNKNLPTKIENLKIYVGHQKWYRKNIEKEIIKGYIKDFSQIIRLIENEWKLEELNNTVKNIKWDINNLKNKVIKLNNKIDYYFSPNSGLNCSNILALFGGAVSVIPVVGTLGSALATIASSAACAIANT